MDEHPCVTSNNDLVLMRLRPKGLLSLRFGKAAFLFNNSFKTTGCRVFQHPAKAAKSEAQGGWLNRSTDLHWNRYQYWHYGSYFQHDQAMMPFRKGRDPTGRLLRFRFDRSSCSSTTARTRRRVIHCHWPSSALRPAFAFTRSASAPSRLEHQTLVTVVARHAWMFIHLTLAPNPRSHEAPRWVTASFNPASVPNN